MEPSTIWLLIAAALVLFMTPGLAFFYGGLVKSTSVVSMMMLSFGAIGVVNVLWYLYGSNLGTLSGDGFWGSLVGNPFSDLALGEAATSDPSTLASVAFAGTFAVISVALISGAVADRARFFPWLIFAGVWATLVYFPSQGWLWSLDDEGPTGWMGKLTIGGVHTIDWAGGTVVHISAGAAALALALVLGQRRVGFAKEAVAPHNVPLVLIGAAILWFGWFGFNTGAATDAGTGSLIFVNTVVAPAAGILGFIATEHFRDGKPTAIGAASGLVAGLVAITPACANLTPWWSMVLGLIAGVVCCLAIDLKYRLGFDDSLDVVGLHLVAGALGCLFLGFFAIETGLFTGGGIDQLLAQVVPTVIVAVYSFGVAWIVGKAIERTIGFRVEEEVEIAGLDNVLHGGEAYKFD